MRRDIVHIGAGQLRYEIREIVKTAEPGAEANVLEAAYYRPYQMHGSIGPSVAIAEMASDGTMIVHTHSQAVYAAATAIEELLGMEEGSVRCIHGQGSGCYGHNMADDAAADAALLAKEMPGVPIKLMYTRAEEHKWEPYGSAMIMKTRAGVDGNGDVVN